MNLNGKTALVTGASSGIGKAAALRLGQAGARVCINSLDDRGNAEEVAKLIREGGNDSFEVQADVSDGQDVKKLIEAVIDRWGRIDILVNNAGISGAGTSFFEISEDAWDRMIRINLKSVFLCCQAVLRTMMEAGYGRIVNISSVAGLSGIVECNAHYAAAKGGIIAMTRRLARDFGKYDITVNCIAPGLIHDTGFNRTMTQEKLNIYINQIPLGRPGYTGDVAGLIAFLASDEADFITGQVIVVDGGATC